MLETLRARDSSNIGASAIYSIMKLLMLILVVGVDIKNRDNLETMHTPEIAPLSHESLP